MTYTFKMFNDEFTLDLSPEEAAQFLETCEMRVEEVPATAAGVNGAKYAMPGWTVPHVKYNGEWMRLSRTDLVDNVATGSCVRLTGEEWRQHYIAKARKCYGVRINHWDDGRKSFCIVDAWSDG